MENVDVDGRLNSVDVAVDVDANVDVDVDGCHCHSQTSGTPKMPKAWTKLWFTTKIERTD